MSKKKSRLRDRKRAGSDKRDSVIKQGGLTTLKIPDGIEIFRPKDKTYKLDILLYEVGKGNPCAEEGEIYYERTYWTHSIGPDNRRRVCPLKTYGKSCPVCEDRAKEMNKPDGDEDLIKSLKPSQRQIFLIHDRDDEDNDVKLFEFSWWKFGRTLDELRQDAEDDEEHITDFDDPDSGSTLRVKFSENPPYGVECRSIEFRQRSKPLPDKWLDHGICLDDMLIVLDYDELKKEYLQIEAQDDDEEKPKRKKKEKEVDSEDDDEETSDNEWMGEGVDAVHDEYGLVEIAVINRTKTKAKVEDMDGDEHTVSTDDLKPVPENPCKACKGTGKSSKGGVCKPCKGTGSKQKEEEEPEDDIPFDDDEKDDSDSDDFDEDENDDWD